MDDFTIIDRNNLLLSKGNLHDMSEKIGERTCTMDVLGSPLCTMPNRAMIRYLYKRQGISTFCRHLMKLLPQKRYQLSTQIVLKI